MPCGKDADCLPENLSHPGTMGDSVSYLPLEPSTLMYQDPKSDTISFVFSLFSGSGEGGCNGIFEHPQGRTCFREALNLG